MALVRDSNVSITSIRPSFSCLFAYLPASGLTGIKGFALPIGGGHGGGRFEVYFPILDRIYQTPAIGSDTRVEAHVDVCLVDVASENKRGAGLVGAGVALAQYVQQHTCR